MSRLLASHTATDGRYERRGAGGLMVRRAIKRARSLPGRVGCGAVPAGPEPGVAGFYERLGSKKASGTGANPTDMYTGIKPPQTR